MVYKIFIALLFVINSYAQVDFADIKTFKADFTQSVINESKKELKYEGTLYIDIDKKVLWQYKSPMIKNVYLLDDSVIIDEPELEQAIFTSVEKGFDFVSLLKNAKKINKKQYLSTIQGIEYFINIVDSKIDSIQYKDSFDNSVVIRFKNTQTNIFIDDSIFTFLPPEYYDIIRK